MKLREIVISTDPEDILLHEEQLLWEKVSFRSNTTGIPNIVIWTNPGERAKHGPRIKVVRGDKWKDDDNATIPLTGAPRIIGANDLTQDEFSKIIEWINLNRTALIQYWNGDFDTADLVHALQKIVPTPLSPTEEIK